MLKKLKIVVDGNKLSQTEKKLSQTEIFLSQTEMVSIFLLYFCSAKTRDFFGGRFFAKRNKKITGMNRNFTLCNEAPGGFDTFGTSGMSGTFGTSAALKGNAAARFGIAPAKADNSLSVSEIRGGWG